MPFSTSIFKNCSVCLQKDFPGSFIVWITRQSTDFTFVYRIRILNNIPVLTTHGNPPVAIGGPPVATGGGKLGYMEAFPSVATGGPPMDHRWKIRKFRK